MKKSIAKYFVVYVLFASVLNLAGCAILLNVKKDTQDIIIVAEDGGVYDFYVDNSIVFRNTDRCVYVHSKGTPCQHTFDLKRGDDIYGTLFYGYWEEKSTLAKMMSVSKREDNACPEEWEGEAIHVIVEIDPDIDGREDSAAR